MVNRVLVTTPIEETWPNDPSTPVLFLGDWCRIYSRKECWEKMNAKVFPYHWDDRRKLFEDYKYLLKLYEILLAELSDKLNHIHSVEHTYRYWRILLGPWLGYFIQMLFDRWFMLKEAIENNKITTCWVLARDPMSIVPIDMNHFVEFFISDDWNEAIYGQILNLCFVESIKIEMVQSQKNDKIQKSGIRRLIRGNKSKFAETGIHFWNKLLPKNDGHFFHSSYLPLKEDFKLQLRLGQFPKLWRQQCVPSAKPEHQQRQWTLDYSKFKISSFESIAHRLIPQHIPTAYLEGYNKLSEKAKLLPWPIKPKAIFTSNAYSANDLFKVWAAEKIEVGVPLVIGQHGGHFGMSPFAFDEDHQINISDKWLSWGWSDFSKPQIVPLGNLKNTNGNFRYDSNGGALMVGLGLPRYSYQLCAFPVSSQYNDYLDDQFAFVSALPSLIQKELTVRCYKKDYGWEQLARWKEKHPNIQLDLGNKKIKKLISKCRICISTYNATTYLESFAMNIPTVMFWNPKHWELRNSAKPYFEKLREVGVFHETPESAAEHISKIWDNVDNWWSSAPVIKAVKYFNENYNKTNINIVDIMYKELNNLSKNDKMEAK